MQSTGCAAWTATRIWSTESEASALALFRAAGCDHAADPRRRDRIRRRHDHYPFQIRRREAGESGACKTSTERLGMEFSVRLNCTSDISPLAFVLDGKNILEIFPNVSFYDYTKVKSRWEVAERYENYYITYSRDGSVENEEECLEWLRRGNNVAVVFGVTKPSELPKKWKGYEVLVGDDYDYRVWDKLQVGKQIVGLVYKVGKNDFDVVNGKHVFRGIPNSPFIISPNDRDCEF